MDIEYLECEVIVLPDAEDLTQDEITAEIEAIYLSWFTDWMSRCDQNAE